MIYTLTTSIRWRKKCLNDSNLPAAMTRKGKWLKSLWNSSPIQVNVCNLICTRTVDKRFGFQVDSVEFIEFHQRFIYTHFRCQGSKRKNAHSIFILYSFLFAKQKKIKIPRNDMVRFGTSTSENAIKIGSKVIEHFDANAAQRIEGGQIWREKNVHFISITIRTHAR